MRTERNDVGCMMYPQMEDESENYLKAAEEEI